mmetsp:Transcript_1920/g.3759  ORF Transcript_1920/g.3759 Transcript_1920/m.3759 type:complete len:94 (+) Transcript_1920:174-455(+)
MPATNVKEIMHSVVLKCYRFSSTPGKLHQLPLSLVSRAVVQAPTLQNEKQKKERMRVVNSLRVPCEVGEMHLHEVMTAELLPLTAKRVGLSVC